MVNTGTIQTAGDYVAGCDWSILQVTIKAAQLLEEKLPTQEKSPIKAWRSAPSKTRLATLVVER